MTAASPTSTAASSTSTSGNVAQSLERPTVALVDPHDEGESGDFAFPTYRVEVKTADRTDTIATVRTHTMPVVGVDRRVYFFGHHRGGFLVKGYIYDPISRTLTTLPTPPGAGSLESHMATSPDAKHIAYISTECASTYGCGMVRSWPAGKLVAEVPGGTWCEGDEDYNYVRWLDSSHAEIAYCAEGPHDFWIHSVIGTSPREVKVDTLPARPNWER